MVKVSILAQSAGYSAIALAVLHGIFLAPLAEQAKEMNEKQLDPTEIVAIPYDLQLLTRFVLSITSLSILVQRQTGYILQLSQTTVMYIGVMVLCGASPYENRVHTALASLYLSTLTLFDPPLSGSYDRQKLKRLIQFFTIAGTVPAQILLLYDNGWQVQRWPIPVVLGSTYGWAAALITWPILEGSTGVFLRTQKVSAS